ncbi:MAG: M28 family peptidase [Proteobacteria bacterium]|nr:M28 family peptidase [Pseudomonadota bacterium]
MRIKYLLLVTGTLFFSTARIGAAASTAEIDPARMAATVKALAADDFEGRSPGTPGEQKTRAYLIDQFESLGLQPAGVAGGWTQPVPLLHTQIADGGNLSLTQQGRKVELARPNDISVTTVRSVDRIDIRNAPMVFVGYGVSAPERKWDDFKGMDVRNKVIVMLVNDPDFAAARSEPVYGRFGGRRMTYYGRWTYKFEEAARRGALAALVIHDTAAAGYPWSTVIAPGGQTYDVPTSPEPRVLLQGWLEASAAKALFQRAGLDLADLSARARKADFHPIQLPATSFSASLSASHSIVESANVLAKLEGKERPQESVVFGAHWDAFGVGAPDSRGQTIRHGANDDGVGVAGVLELARVFSHQGARRRTLVFGLWTAEERGLLGSEAYALAPGYPLDKTVANLTIDTLETAGLARDILLVGEGQSDLDGRLREAATAQGRTVVTEPYPERGFFYRADHFSFAKRGVPTLVLMGGLAGPADLVNGGKAAGERWFNDYMRCYHQPCDNWDESWDLRGAAQDVGLLYAVGKQLADSAKWPAWSADSEFHRPTH